MARKRMRTKPVEEPKQEEQESPLIQRNDEDRIIATYKERIKNPLTAIRSHCVECFGGAPRQVAECTSKNCSLWPFRMGKNTMHGTFGKKREPKED